MQIGVEQSYKLDYQTSELDCQLQIAKLKIEIKLNKSVMVWIRLTFISTTLKVQSSK